MTDRIRRHGVLSPHLSSGETVRVCHVVATAEGGTWHVQQLQRLKTHYGYDTVSLLPDKEGSLERRLEAAGIPCLKTDFDFPSLPPFRDLIQRVVRLAALFRHERFDVVQTTLWHSMLLGRLAAWLADVPVRAHMAAGIFHQEAPITRWIDRDTCWMETVLIGGCRYLADIYGSFGISNRRRKTVYFGPDESTLLPGTTKVHDLRTEMGWPQSTPVIVQVAWFYGRVPNNRWVPASVLGNAVKGHEDLIRAAPFVLERYPGAKIVFVGSGWLESGQAFMAEMQALVEELNLKDSVIFIGARSDVSEILRGVDVAVQPSRNECCGGVLESLLMECPTVATRVGGMPEIVIDGKTGVLVEPANPKDLARGICSLLDDRTRGRSLARAGRTHVLAVATLTKTVSDLDSIYREFLFQGGRRRRGYRLWVSALRFPVVVLVSAYLCWRLLRVEYYYLPKWESGWRPWHGKVLLSVPGAIWSQPSVFLLRHRIYCSLLTLQGHAISLWQRSVCRYHVITGTVRGWLRCYACKMRGYALGLYQRLFCRFHVVRGTLLSYPQRMLCWSYRVRGNARGLWQQAVCQAYRIAGTVRSYPHRLLCWSYRVRGSAWGLYHRSICRAYLLVGMLRSMSEK